MSKSVQINIPTPCHESWHKMTPNEQGRFCGSCRKTVVDFSAMSDKELLDYISNADNQRVCGRFAGDQLNRKINVTEKRKRFSWAYIWNLLLATFLVTESYAQGEPQMKKKPEVQLPDISPRVGTFAVKNEDTVPSREIRGTIINRDSKTPVANATVMVQGTSGGVVTDDKGKFMLKVKNKDKVTLVVSSLGYKTQTVVLTNNQKWQSVKVLMKEDDTALMGDVVIMPLDN
jgi:hypothetical protein